METNKINASLETESKPTTQAFGLNFLGEKSRALVNRARGMAQAPHSLRPAKSLRPKLVKPMSITAPSIKAK